jgi:hypothetical protein
MQIIINKEKQDLVRPFEGFDYVLVANKPLQVEDGLYEHLKEVLPLSFDFAPELKKDAVVAKVHKTPTKAVFPGGKFGVQSANLTKSISVDGLSEADGFTGPGLENDTI